MVKIFVSSVVVLVHQRLNQCVNNYSIQAQTMISYRFYKKKKNSHFFFPPFTLILYWILIHVENHFESFLYEF